MATKKMYVKPEKPLTAQNRSTIYSSIKHLENQQKGLIFAQRRHLEGIKANSSFQFYFENPKDKSLFVTINPKAQTNKFQGGESRSNNQRSTIFSNQVLLQHNNKFVKTQSKKHFRTDYKNKGLGAKATFNPSSPPAYTQFLGESKVNKVSPKKNLCSLHNPLQEKTMSPKARFTNPSLKNPIRTEGRLKVKTDSGNLDSTLLHRSGSMGGMGGIRGAHSTLNGIPKFLLVSGENTLSNGYSFLKENGKNQSYSNIFKSE